MSVEKYPPNLPGVFQTVTWCASSLQPIGDAVVGKEMEAKICFTNPLPRTLKSVVFRVEGLGLQNIREIAVG